MTNKEIVLKFYDEVFNGWHVEKIDEYIDENYKQHNPTVEDGLVGFKKFMEKFLSFKPHMEISQVLEDGDLVCVFFKCTMQANGMENKVFDLYRVKNGKLVEHWDCVQHDTGKVESVNGNSQF